MNPFTGHLLVASSLVTDPIYAGGVCLVVHQDEANVIGLMLNRPFQPSPAAIATMFGNSNPTPISKKRLTRQGTHHQFGSVGPKSEATQPLSGMLHFGGPLSGPVVAIHQTSQYAEAETGIGIYVAAQKQHLESLVREQSSPYRLIVGHLGWQWEQLDAEIEAGFWHVVPAIADTVFGSAKEMWPRLIRRATSNSLARWLGVPDLISAGELN
jgi:putative transcriptional regulator